MNTERIDQLYKEAEKSVVFLSNSEQSKKKIIQRKFAELIVQECMNLLHDNELWNRHISHVLKEHFGVGE